jgi:hypothetical protein
MNTLNHSRTLAARLFAAGLLLASIGSTLAEVRYVAVNSTKPSPPYTNWITAASIIQDAVDAAVAGDEIVVTNGIYAAGGRAVYGTMTNRVAVDKPLTLRSVNGPRWTIIQGRQVTGATNGDGAIRCVYLTNGATLSGFTLTNGATRAVSDDPTNSETSGGGLWCESINDIVVSDCVLTGNSAYHSGGGTYLGTLNNCTVSGNSANWGGGAWSCTLNNCVLSGNDAGSGGGAAYSSLNNCALNCNSAYFGGGTFGSTLNNCTVTGNSAQISGGGAGGSGWSLTQLNNCIVYFNTAPQGANYDSYGFLDYCCTTPLPDGTGNIALDPQLASASYLSAGSPCRAAGKEAFASGTDLDGEAWANPPDIGCDEYHAGDLTGALTVAIAPSFTNVAAGCRMQLTAVIEGRTAASSWDFGDGLTATNQPYASHAWTAPGNYAVVLRAYNDSQPGGITATVVVHVISQPIHYVAAGGTSPIAPFTSWATAATSIQDAVDAATVPGALVLVTNGIYATGSRATIDDTNVNRLVVDKPLAVRSIHGPDFTVIDGGGSNRCVYLADATSLSGFTLTNGSVAVEWVDAGWDGLYAGWLDGLGGGVRCQSTNAVVSNCVVAGNSANEGGGAAGGTLNNCTLRDNNALPGVIEYPGVDATYSYFGGYGGGASGCTLNNCALSGNSASARPYLFGVGYAGGYGGGAASSTLNNCTLSGNTGGYDGGGAYLSTLNNCIVYFNSAGEWSPEPDTWPNYDLSCTLNYCCTTPQPTNGFANITFPPVFVDTNGWANLRLESNSPCINAGNNEYAVCDADLEANPRIRGGTVDIGAYEFQSPTSLISYGWLQQYSLASDGSADFTDPDGDGLNNWEEWRCGTDPTNALSALSMLMPVRGVTNLTLSWQSVAGVNYFLERATDLNASPAFTPLATIIPGRPGITSFTDNNAFGSGPFFYRVGVGD